VPLVSLILRPGQDRLKIAEQLHERAAMAAVLDGRDDAGDGLSRLFQANKVGLAIGPVMVVETVGLLDERPHGLGHRLRGHEHEPQARQNPFFQHGTNDGAAVGAAVAHDVADAAKAVVPPFGDRAAAGAADQQARQQGLGATVGAGVPQVIQSAGLGLIEGMGQLA
jgi:hypothetical protein